MTQANGIQLPRVAIVTGAGSGIGKAAALELLRNGWAVALLGRRIEPLREIANDAAFEERAFAVSCDVSDPLAVTSSFDAVVAHFGRIDLLFNNAGIGNPPGSFETWTPEQWRGTVDVNLNGMFFCLQRAFRIMSTQTPRGGRVINNGSLSAWVPRPNSIAYTATKHAVTGLTRCAALDGRAYDIAVGQIDVGNAHSDLAGPMAHGVPQANGELSAEPLIDAEIVGRSVAYMANLPLDANVLFHTVMATKMPFVGRG
ncbi:MULTISPECIES: SDR family oxidoreductase [Paraburkholderia]|uniref:SDR family oxidoreductase n=1 Tax=Paraburkholderia TaxID=1822464 RepID=UPI0006D3EC3A|nr:MULTISPECIES: SDR family oxidoreductase [Paraburkholderia]ALP66017.1 3-oxoacyl-ACP reductase [Paraburkholderia caribensis]AMV45986.1 3-oxoacyl-ACP reductase [Paraburkholderia caribensis]AUT55053.1 3-oxoacyl-ACP reductase [Paraburkholderia caribensis]CAG9213437.1 3-oxoacyl-ACP reductase [Paraburkholderia caribensis]